ncbi:MAG: hypothetical protein ACYC35_24565 [Pirellulales bacterium]
MTVNIDEVVREVMARLGLTPGDQAAVAPTGTPQAPAAGAADTAGELELSDRVLTLAGLDRLPNGIRRVSVPRGTVVTPAAADQLRRRNVELTYQASAAGQPAAGLRLLLAVAETACDPAALVSALGRDGIQVERIAAGSLAGAVGELTGKVRAGGALGMVITGQSAAALCLANRIAGIRAALGADAAAVAQAVGQVGANLLVVDPSGISFFQLKQIVGEFCRGGLRDCPAAYREGLN